MSPNPNSWESRIQTLLMAIATAAIFWVYREVDATSEVLAKLQADVAVTKVETSALRELLNTKIEDRAERLNDFRSAQEKIRERVRALEQRTNR